MCPLCVLLLWAFLCPGTGNVPSTREEIFTRPGSDLFLPNRHRLTLSHTDIRRCDGFYWIYKRKTDGHWQGITSNKDCKPFDRRHSFNTRLSENASLTIYNVTLDNDGIYGVEIYRRGHHILTDLYTVHVEGNGVQEEIFTRPGSDLLIPTRRHLILNHTDTERCDWFSWDYYRKALGYWGGIVNHWNCKSSEIRYFTNTKLSENGSLIISNVTLENDGRYILHIFNSVGHRIQIDEYTIHVEGNGVPEEIFTRPGSDLLLPIRLHLNLNRTDRQRCDRFSWYYKKYQVQWEEVAKHRNCGLSESRYFPNTRISEDGSLIISNVTLENNGTYFVDIYNSAGEHILIYYYTVHVEGKSRSGWGHFLSSGAVFVLYTGLLIFMVNDLRKIKNEKNRSERSTRRRDLMEMEMEPTYYDDCY